ncbi:MAG: pyrroline-5-carboxylate reductase, partial [Clostridia bacterium]|nr:pyrroline-5-carboxylate reductase [Clostridia bacterium]
SKFDKFNKLGIITGNDLCSICSNPDFVFLAVKPNIVSNVMARLSEIPGLLDNATIVSFAAAVSIEHIVKSYGSGIPVIRTMPSTPILVGEGVIAVTKNDRVSPKNFEFFCRIMSTIAHVTVISEDLMNPIIAVHGSSPAYVYLFVKAMLDGAEEQGIERSVALPLILKTIKGSVTMIEKCDDSIEQLISNVASPNGTTLAALNSFENDDFCGSVSRAMQACTKRSNEISSEL